MRTAVVIFTLGVVIMAVLLIRADQRIAQLERLSCGFVQYEDLSVVFEKSDEARWQCVER